MALIGYLTDRGYEVEVEPFGRYDIDLGAKKKGENILIDVEVKINWTRGSFPFKTVHLPKRKAKFLKHVFPVYFVIFRQDLENFVIICGKILRNTVVVQNKYMPNGEEFFSVPIDQCDQVLL